MNIIAFVLSLFSALISFLQGGCGTVISGMGGSLSEHLGDYGASRKFAVMGGSGLLVMLASILGVIGGSLALARKKSGSIFLFICAGMCGIAFAGGFKDAAVYAVIYAVAAFCAMAGSNTENQSTSQTNYSSHTSSSSSHTPYQGPTLLQVLEKTQSSQSTKNESQKTYEPIIGLETESLLKRAFLFLEDGQFDDAGRYLNQALNQDAENSRVYLGQLLLAYKAHNTEELIDKLSKPIEEEKLFQRALRFADDNYKQELEALTQASKTNMEQKRIKKEAEQEKHYQDILNMKSKADRFGLVMLDDLLRHINALRPYKDTDKLYSEVSEIIRLEKKYQEVTKEKSNAKTQQELQHVISQLEELKSYKDSEDLIKQAQAATDDLKKKEVERARRTKKMIKRGLALLLALFIAVILAKPFTCYQIGKLYEEGRYVEKNLDKAKEWYKSAGWKGERWRSDYNSWEWSVENDSQSSSAKAYFAFLCIDAEQGITEAQEKLGDAYYYARGIERDYSKAAEWYLKAAQQGNTYSQYSLAQMYEEGKGVEKNINVAIEWYKKVDNQGGFWTTYAISALGRIYEEGKDVERDLNEARKWYQMVIDDRRASDSDRTTALEGLERIKRLEREEREKLIRYQKLAESGDVEAQNYLRDLQEKQKAKEEQERKAKELEEQKAREEQRAKEEAAEKKRAEAMRIYSSAEINEANGNLDLALSQFRFALELGHPEAQNRITALQEKINARDNESDDDAYARAVQYLDEKNYSQAIDIFRKLANNDYAPAQDKLAWMYQNGWGVEQSYSQAVSWFRKAAEQGNTEAMASMGLMYYRGWGVERDYDTSLEWYGKAARQGSEVAQRRINSIQTLKANKQKIASIERNDDFPIPGTITAETLSVRQSPNTNSTRIKTLRTGHPVSVSKATESDNDYWLYIRTASGTEGWVLGGYVKLIDRNLSYEETNNRRRSLPKSGYVATHNDTLNLRNIPAVKGSQVIEKLDSGTSFTAYEVFAGDTVDWYRIRTNYGDEGWVSGKYIELQY